MRRSRQIAASPARSASTTWAVLAGLIADTVARAPALSRAEAEQALAAAAPVGRMLIAAGHLDRHPITLVAGRLHCAITTVSGTAALTHEENLNPIPGAADAEDFTVYLPTPAPLQDLVTAAAAAHARLSAAASPTEKAGAAEAAARSGPLIDQAALDRAASQAGSQPGSAPR